METMEALWPAIELAITKEYHKNNLKVPPEVIEHMRMGYTKHRDIELFDPKDNITDDVGSVQDKKIIIEIETKSANHYAGYDEFTAASELTSRCEFPVYQIIFEDINQRLIFEFVGDNHKKLKAELEKIYPGCHIEQSHDDYTIGNRGYQNYEHASSEFDRMRNILDKVDHKLAYQCHKKELGPVTGSDRLATRMKLQNRERITDMVFGHITVNITHIENFTHIAGNQIINNNYNDARDRTDIHRDCLSTNPPHVGEYAKQYYDRVSALMDDPLTIYRQAKLLRELGYKSEKKTKGTIWFKKNK